MKPIDRRRLGQLGRMVASVAYDVHGPQLDAPGTIPVVLGSRYGDLARSLELLAALARGEPMSPTGFSFSVHNAIGAMYSIARGDVSNYLALAGGSASAAMCLVEAAGLLADGAREVLVICYDAPLPTPYDVFTDDPAANYAWAWRVRHPVGSALDAPLGLPSAPCVEADHIVLRFRSSTTQTDNVAEAGGEPTAVAGAAISDPASAIERGLSTPRPDLPFGLDVLRFMLSADRELERAEGGTTWTWRRRNG